MTAGSADRDDPLREVLLDAAARVVARAGYDGARVQDIVREAGLSTGAVYGRFRSKNELLQEAVISRSTPHVDATDPTIARVADLVARGATADRGPLTDVEALLLETYVTARREPEVAAAVLAADREWNAAVAPLVAAALRDGTVAEGVDPEAVLFLVKVLRIGLLLHRGSGLSRPDQGAWESLVAGVVASFGSRGPGPARS